ncbi:MAG: hypothetical protein ACLVI9_03665 [Anaerostipes hadrus]
MCGSEYSQKQNKRFIPAKIPVLRYDPVILLPPSIFEIKLLHQFSASAVISVNWENNKRQKAFEE